MSFLCLTLPFDLVDFPSLINACIAGVSEPTCDLVDLPSVIGATVQSVTNVSLTYSCDERHVYTGGQTTVICTDQGEWPTPNITCEGEICMETSNSVDIITLKFLCCTSHIKRAI